MLLCMTVSTIYNVNERVPMSGLVDVSMLLPLHYSHFWTARICGTRAIQHRNIQEAFQNLDRNLDKLPGNNQGISSNHWCQPWPLAGLLQQKKLIFHNSLVTHLLRGVGCSSSLSLFSGFHLQLWNTTSPVSTAGNLFCFCWCHRQNYVASAMMIIRWLYCLS